MDGTLRIHLPALKEAAPAVLLRAMAATLQVGLAVLPGSCSCHQHAAITLARHQPECSFQ